MTNDAPIPATDQWPRPVVIVGPTAGGKSELAVCLAEATGDNVGAPNGDATGGEVLGADSMQVYRQMDAGTAKPSPEQRARATHHLIDIVEPTERFTVAQWLTRAEAVIDDLRERGRRAVIVGGTNLYLNALLRGLFEGPPQDELFRADAAQRSPQALHEELRRVDPVAAERIHPNDHKKLVRALEVFRTTGKPISEWQTQWEQETANAPYRHDPVLVGLHWPVDAINQRINLRVKAMFFPDRVDPAIAKEVTPTGESLIDETARLEAAGLLGPQAREALGYKQVLAHLRGEMTLDEAFERTKVLTRRFAKSQRTWLKRYRGVRWLDPSVMPWAELVAEARRHIDASEANLSG